MRGALLLVTAGAAALGGLLGFWAGPVFARENLTVQVSDRIALEDAKGLADRTLESEAFRSTGRPAAALHAEAAAIVRRFRIGSVLLGSFCGLALGVKLLRQSRIPPWKTYVIDRDECVSCARCFMACPRERLRRKTAFGDRSAEPEVRRGRSG